MNKRIIITAIICIVVGFIGLIPLSILSVPYFFDVTEKAVAFAQKEATLEKMNEWDFQDQKKIILSTEANITIEQSDSNKIELYVPSTRKELLSVQATNKNDSFNLNIESKSEDMYNPFTNFNTKTFIQDIANEIASQNARYRNIILRVPKGVEWEIQSTYHHVFFKDSNVLGENVVFKTTNGNIEFNNDVTEQPKQRTKLIIQSSSNVSFSSPSLFKNVTIQAPRVSVNEQKPLWSKNVCESLTIRAQYSVYASSQHSLAKSVNISLSQQYGPVELNLPFVNENIVVNISNDEGSLYTDYNKDFYGEELKAPITLKHDGTKNAGSTMTITANKGNINLYNR